MSDESDKPRPHRRAAWLIVTVLVVVFLLYPLSSGPVLVLAYRNLDSQRAIWALYEPLNFAARKSGTREKYCAYLHWWFEVTNTAKPISLWLDLDQISPGDGNF